MINSIPFTEDAWWNVSNSLSVNSHILKLKNWRELMTEEDVTRLLESIEQYRDFASTLYSKYADQFIHDPQSRSVCPNPKCHNVYAYFWDDWKYCPKCGTALKFTYKNQTN